MNQSALLLALAATLGCLTAPAHAQPPAGEPQIIHTAKPGKALVARKQVVTATVEAIDVAQRLVTLKGPKGQVVDLGVSPDVRNLEQVKVGDSVKVAYLESLSLELKKDGKALRSATSSADGARAAEGDRPAGIVGEKVTVIADVIALNPKKNLVTLRGPKRTVELNVSDPKQFKLIKVGDQVEAVYTQALAVAVEPAASAKK
jgi:Cu/Ag efflux protein CusF